MVIFGSHMHKFSVCKDMKNNLTMIKGEGDMIVGKVVAHLCLTLIIKELKFSVEHDRVVTTLNTIKH
jgi:hypothetical protein